MSYNFDFAVSAEITAKVVEEMIRKVVEEQTGKKVTKIEFKIKSKSMGDQRDSWTENAIDGCTVFFENEKSNRLSGAGFKTNSYGDR